MEGEKSKSQMKNETKRFEKLAKFNAKKEKLVNQNTEKSKVKREKVIKKVELQSPVFDSSGKKDVSGSMPESYSPKYVEALWYEWWEKSGFFAAEYWMSKKDPENPKKRFVMVIPPPNVTGNLHLGHALTNSIEDAITRWHRMRGEITLWVPGCDHAGIATQVVVEKRLWRERQQTRHELGREAFIQEVIKWKDEKESNIYGQLKALGSSCDWSRAAFTMNPMLNRAVIEGFVRMYESGHIYRGVRLVNWCCTLQSAISDIEVEKRELTGRTAVHVPGYQKPVIFGIITSFAYPLVGSTTGEELVVATTRLETMLGDTGVAVHPKDPRYMRLVGRFVQHPFLPERQLPIIADEFVDREFGTGAVKLTPAHDHTDYEVGLRHRLPFITVIDESGVMTKEAGPQFAGMKRFDARWAVRKLLEEKKLFRGEVENPMILPTCSRTNDIIEPLLKPQWYVKCQDLANMAMKEVADGNLKIIPSMYINTWNAWLRDCQDWCISRQLWWGHRIPAYLVAIKKESGEFELLDSKDNGSWVVARNEKEALDVAVKIFNRPASDICLHQDEDVLDTWFSSQLFPMSVFGWPDVECADFKSFYPGSLLETGHDILFFWVARMVMAGLFFTGKLPFTEVYLHAMVRDAHGKKMSKSLGNAIDPIDVINGINLPELQAKLLTGNLDAAELTRATAAQAKDFPSGIPECGTDALRFTLCSFPTRGRSINLNILSVQGYRFFCNKLWNAIRYAIYHCLQTGYTPDKFLVSLNFSSTADTRHLSGTDQWILSCLARAVDECNKGFSDYHFPRATTACYNFWLYEFCDVYLEYSKPIVKLDANCSKHAQDRAEVVRHVVYTCIDVGLRLLHPFMPFVTEELYQRLPRRNPSKDAPSICVAAYPNDEETSGWRENATVSISFRLAFSLVHRLRSLYSIYNLQTSGKAAVCPEAIIVSSENILTSLRDGCFLSDIVESMGRCKLVAMASEKSKVDTTGCIMVTVSATDASVEHPQDDCKVLDAVMEDNDGGTGEANVKKVDEEQSADQSVVVPTCQLYLRLTGLIDTVTEVGRINQRVTQIKKSVETLIKARSLPSYTAKVPAAKQAADYAKLQALEHEIEGLLEIAESLRNLSDSKKKSRRVVYQEHTFIALVMHFQNTSSTSPNDYPGLFDPQALAEVIGGKTLTHSNNPLVCADIKQIVAWCLRLLPDSVPDPKLSIAVWQEFLERRLNVSKYGYLAATTSISLADLAALLICLQHKLNLRTPEGQKWLDTLRSDAKIEQLIQKNPHLCS